MAPSGPKRVTQKIIGVELEIEDGLTLKQDVERQLAVCVPGGCHSVANFKAHLVQRLFHEDQDIKLYLEDTRRELPDFTSSDVFVAFKGRIVRVAPNHKPKSSLEAAKDSSPINIVKRKRVVRFEDEDEVDDVNTQNQPQDSEGTGSLLTDPENLKVSEIVDSKICRFADSSPPPPPVSSFASTPVPDSTPEFHQDQEIDCESGFSGFSPCALSNDFDDLTQETGLLEQCDLDNQIADNESAGNDETQSSTDLEAFGTSYENDSTAELEMGIPSPIPNFPEFTVPSTSAPLDTSQLSDKENLATGIQRLDEMTESGLKWNDAEDQVDNHNHMHSETDLMLSPTHRASKRLITDVALSPLPVFKEKNGDGRDGPKPKKRKRHSRSSLPLIQLPTLIETPEGPTFNDSETSEDDELPRWTSNAELPKFTIKSSPSPPKAVQMQLLENAKTFDAVSQQSYAATQVPLPSIEIQEFTQANFGQPEPRMTRRASSRAAAASRDSESD